MPKSFAQIGIEQIKQTLSEFYGDSKRIGIRSIMMNIETDDSVKNADASWLITKNDVKDHFDTLQGVQLIEAASQSIVCIVKALRLFPGHQPAFLGVDSFRIFSPIYEGDELWIKIRGIDWKGKKGTAAVEIACKERKVAEISKLMFRANDERAIRRLGFILDVA